MADRRAALTESFIAAVKHEVDSKYTRVTLSAMRAREHNDSYNQLGEGLGRIVPPQVTSYSRKPLSLASALQKIAGAAQRIPNMPAERNPASAHLFIVNPLSGARMDNLFSTHPNVENRVAALQEIARGMGESGPSVGASEDSAGPWSAPQSRVAGRGPWG